MTQKANDLSPDIRNTPNPPAFSANGKGASVLSITAPKPGGDGSAALELKAYIAPLVKWWWLLLAATAVAFLSSYLATKDQPPIYQTTATLMVGRFLDNPNPSGGEFSLAQQLAQAYVEIARRSPVRNATMAALGLAGLPPYNVAMVPNTQLIEIRVIDTSPERAQAVAAELAQQLILQSPAGAQERDEQRQAFLQQQLDELEVSILAGQNEIAEYQEQLKQLTSARQIADTQAQIAGLESKLRTLQSNYAALLANTRQGATNSIRIIEPPGLPVSPIGPNNLSTLLAAVAIGFVLAAGGAYLLEYLDDTIKGADDVQTAFGLPTLGMIPKKEVTGSRGGLGVDAGSVTAEAYRILRGHLQFAASSQPLRSVLVTSLGASDGKTTTVVNLGAALAQVGQRVILVDADLRQSDLHRYFSLSNAVGLTTALQETEGDLDQVLQQTHIAGLWVLTTGPLPFNPGNWLESPRMHTLLEGLAAKADMVILDTPPVTALADAVVLSPWVDGVLVVMEPNKTRRSAALKVLASLAQVNAHVLGVVLNRVPAPQRAYDPYGGAQRRL